MPECLFCGIIAGSLPSKKVFENEEVVVIHDLHPKAPVHVLIIPKKHIVSANDLSESDQNLAGKLLLAAKRVAGDLGVAQNGYKIIINTGKDGGQLIGHLHLHLLGGGMLTSVV